MGQLPEVSKLAQQWTFLWSTSMENTTLKTGDKVKLLSKPVGHDSGLLPLTVGSTYIVRYMDGSNVCTSTDLPGLDGHYSRSRVEKIS